ncbi:MAG TPA: hypothetical protein GX743_09880 [Actinomycetales bacterium]|nr:hypothetical protein [Actinomycetales bacterium]
MGPILMLVIGILVGAVAAAIAGITLLGIRLATVGEIENIIHAEEGPTEEPTEPAAPTTPGDVPEVCVRASEYALAVDEGIDDLARGARDEDALTLQLALDEIQTAREEADGAPEECLELSRQPGGAADATDDATDNASEDPTDDATDDATEDATGGATESPSPASTAGTSPSPTPTSTQTP